MDDKEGEDALLVREWEPFDIRVLHSDDLSDFEVMAGGGRPDGWPEPPYNLQAAVIDLDLGHKGPGPAGGVVATHRLLRWQRENRTSIPIALRTADVDDDRALAAVLAAELVDGPLPLWGKSSEDAARLHDFIVDSRSEVRDPLPYGATLVHPVRFMKEERGQHLLGEFLYDGRRASVWERLWDGFDPETAILAAGYRDHNKFWEQHNGLIAAIVHLRDNGTSLHQLRGRVLRLPDIEREIYAEILQDIDVAVYAVRCQDDMPEDTKNFLVARLEEDRINTELWLEGRSRRRPSQKRNMEQGEFLGAFGRVLGHPDVVDLFRH